MRAAYLTSLLITSVLFFIFLIPGLTFWLMFFTLGLVLLIVVPLPYVVLALWLAFPAYSYRAQRPVFWSLLALGGAAFAALLLGPPLVADTRFQRELAMLNQAVQEPVELAQPLGVEIQLVNSPDLTQFELRERNDSHFARTEFCFDLCERLLTGGDVAWVRIVRFSQQRREDDETRLSGTTRLVLASATECQMIVPELFSSRNCVLFVPDRDEPADLTLKIKAETNWSRAPLFRAYAPRAVRSVVAFQGQNSEQQAVFKLGQIQHQRPTGKIVPNTRSSLESSGHGGWRFQRRIVTSDPFDLSEAVERLGLKLGPFRMKDDTQAATYVASLLRPGILAPEVNVPAAFQAMLQEWYRKIDARSGSLTPVELSALCQSLADTRVKSNHLTRKLLSKHGTSCP